MTDIINDIIITNEKESEMIYLYWPYFYFLFIKFLNYIYI